MKILIAGEPGWSKASSYWWYEWSRLGDVRLSAATFWMLTKTYQFKDATYASALQDWGGQWEGQRLNPEEHRQSALDMWKRMAGFIDPKGDPYFSLHLHGHCIYHWKNIFPQQPCFSQGFQIQTPLLLVCNYTCLAGPQYLTFTCELETLNHSFPPWEIMLENNIAVLSFPSTCELWCADRST